MNFISNFNWRPTLSGIALSLLLATGCGCRSDVEKTDFPDRAREMGRHLGA